jgi:hypothetical protein
MVLTLFFYELGLLALVWLFLLLCWLGPDTAAVRRQPSAPSKPPNASAPLHPKRLQV